MLMLTGLLCWLKACRTTRKELRLDGCLGVEPGTDGIALMKASGLKTEV